MQLLVRSQLRVTECLSMLFEVAAVGIVTHPWGPTR
jgi:hypothetical protein